MGNGYTRQSAANIANGLVIYAADINNELNALQSAFNGTTGHVHDGSTGNAPKISLTSSISGILPVANGGIGGISNLSATVNPTNFNDNTQGYVVGSIWINTTSQLFFVCVNSTTSAAVWQQHQINNANLTAISGLTTAANQLMLATGVATFSMIACTALAQTLLGNATTTAMQTTLGLLPGTNVEAWSAGLDNLSTLGAGGGTGLVVQTGVNTFTDRTLTGTANQITVTNGTGVAGNPTFSFPTSMTMTGITLTGGTYASATFTSGTFSSGTWSSGALTSSSVTFTGGSLTGVTIDNSVIGGTTPAAGTFTTVTGNTSLNSATINQSAAAGTATTWNIQTAGSQRWLAGKNTTAEGGSNTGSDFIFNRYNDAGALLDNVYTVTRSTGQITLNHKLITLAGVAGEASLNIPHGVAPTSPVNGDEWTTTSGFFVRINGATKTMQDLESAQTVSGAKTFSGTTTHSGQLLLTGVISPPALALNGTNDYSPTGLSTANTIRLTGNASYSFLTGIAAQTSGTILILSNIGSGPIDLIGNNTSSLAANRFLNGPPVRFHPGQSIAIQYDGTSPGWQLLQVQPTWVPRGVRKNLKILTTSVTASTITADEIVVMNSNNDTANVLNLNAAYATGTSGAGGLDTGTITASNWYYEWVIYNPTTDSANVLLSLSSTSPTMPSGYTYRARVGAIYYDAGAKLRFKIQYDRVASIVVGTNPANSVIVANGAQGTYSVTSPTLASVSLTGFVPPTASKAFLNVYTLWKGGGGSDMHIAPSTSYGGANNGVQGTNGNVYPSSLGNASAVGQRVEIVLEALSFGVTSNAAGAAIALSGWEDNL